jgi:hypothetical protein
LLSRTKRMEDEELKKKLAAQQAAYQRYQRLNAPDDKA